MGVAHALKTIAHRVDSNKENSRLQMQSQHQHQAISVVPAEQEPNTVVMVLQKGYLIADRVLRPALVTVTAPK